jgi:hypothetical protein
MGKTFRTLSLAALSVAVIVSSYSNSRADTQSSMSAAYTGSNDMQGSLTQAIAKAVHALHDRQSAQQFRHTTDWTLLALFAAGVDGTDANWRNSAGLSGLDQLEQQLEDPKKQLLSFATTDYERTLLGVVAGGKDPRSFARRDWILTVEDSMRPDGKFADQINGSGEDLVNAQIWGILSLYAANQSIPQADLAANWLNQTQHADGGWNWSRQDGVSDTDITAMTLIAYHALQIPNTDPHVQKALQFLRSRQSVNGGFVGADGTSSTETTAVCVEALLAQGIDPTSWKQGTKDPVTFLLQSQLADGSFVHQITAVQDGTDPAGNEMSTIQALMALGDCQTNRVVYDRLRDKSRLQQNGWKLLSDDVPSDSVYLEAIRRLQGIGIVRGYEDGTFRPDNPISRAEFASMLVRALNKQDQIGPTTSRFRDVPTSKWYNPVIKVAYENGIVSGVGANAFQPERQVSGAEVMTMLVRAMGLADQALNIQGPNWYTGYVQIATQSGLLYHGFVPDRPATRAQCAEAIHHYFLWLAHR